MSNGKLGSSSYEAGDTGGSCGDYEHGVSAAWIQKRLSTARASRTGGRDIYEGHAQDRFAQRSAKAKSPKMALKFAVARSTLGARQEKNDYKEGWTSSASGPHAKWLRAKKKQMGAGWSASGRGAKRARKR